jgi:hypothetical protein
MIVYFKKSFLNKKNENVVLLTKISYVTLHYKLWLRLVNILMYLLIVDFVYKENTKYSMQSKI